jgi:hypothetical protein
MTPFLFAAVLAVVPVGQPSLDNTLRLAPPSAAPSIRSFILPPGVSPPPGARLPDPSTQPLMLRNALASAACAKLESQTVAPDGTPLYKRLDQLPTGLLEHAVWRTVGGCPVREVVINGQTMYLTSPSPKVVRLDPAGFGAIDRR